MIASEAAARDYVLGLSNREALDRIDCLVAQLALENNQQNLVSASTLPSIWQRHIADSAQLIEHVSCETPLWLDLGSGAGFPGLVIAMMRPGWRVHLVESRAKRAAWLGRCAERAGLGNCAVHADRIENIAGFAVDVISARAFAPLPRLLDLSARFSTPDTRWLLPKGRSARQEVAKLPRRRRGMFHVEQSITDADSGIVIGQGKVESIR